MTAEYLDITASVKKKLIHDLTPCGTAVDFMKAMDVVPGSPEVEEMEHRASHLRLAQMATVNPMVIQFASLAGEIVARCILESQGIEPDEEIVKAYIRVAQASSQAVIANLLDMDLLHIGGHW